MTISYQVRKNTLARYHQLKYSPIIFRYQPQYMILVAVVPGNVLLCWTSQCCHLHIYNRSKGPYWPPKIQIYQTLTYSIIVIGPKHAKRVKAYLKPFIDELRLYGPNSSGIKVEDHSLSKSDSAREFFFKLLLLNILGDYPGIAQLLCRNDHKANSGCIKCNQYPRSVLLYIRPSKLYHTSSNFRSS